MSSQPPHVVETTVTPAGEGRVRVSGMRGGRYGEVLLARLVDGRLNAEVWNTFGLNDCPPEAFAELDAETIRNERGVLAALLNGPRYWLMDAIEREPRAERKETTFGRLRMFQAATVDLGPPPPNTGPYRERVVARGTVFEFWAGSEVYELVDPQGRVFVMQAYSTQIDPSLEERALATLGGRLSPPEGWSYRARVLDETLRVDPGHHATVIPDELMNTYSLVTG